MNQTFNGHAYDVRHYQFVRRVTESPVIEVYEPQGKFRWVLAVAISALSLLALFV